MTSRDLPDAALARAVAVPRRRQILDLILAADHPVTVAELTDELGCNHNAVRQHLARLREAGLVVEMHEARDRPGRPRLLYTAIARLDPYARLARVLLAARRSGVSPRAAGRVGRGRRVVLVLDQCPLADVAADDPAAVCALHRGLAEGLVEGIGGARVDAFVAHDPHRAGCRVGVRRTT